MPSWRLGDGSYRYRLVAVSRCESGADGDVGLAAADDLEQAGELLHGMLAVRVDASDVHVLVGVGVCVARRDSLPQTSVLLEREHLGSALSREVGGSVGRPVVDDEDVALGESGPDLRYDGGDVLFLVPGGDEHERVGFHAASVDDQVARSRLHRIPCAGDSGTPVQGMAHALSLPLTEPVDMRSPRYGQDAARSGRRPALREERGQALIMTAVFMTILLVSTGLVVDVGHAMLVQRQLQAGADAAALAGVQHLPDVPMAETVAVQYSATPGSKNAVNTVNNANTTAVAGCISGVPGCNRRDGGVNGIVVTSQSHVPTWFGRIIGLNTLTVNARATACSPCSVKPLDVMVVLDRTGSMCQIQGHSDPACTDLNRAKTGIQTFLTFMDPSIDKVGLALTPPVVANNMISRCPYTPWNGTSNPNPPPASMNGKYYGYDQWWHPDGQDAPNGQDSSFYVVASLEGADGFPADDYLVHDTVTNDWILNSASALNQRLGCARGAGSTSYALAIDSAQDELNRNGRGNVQDVIIFLSDGAANTSPTNVPTAHWTNNGTGPNSWFNRPCGSGVEAANRVKGPTEQGTVVYTIGYDLGVAGGSTEKCQRPDPSTGHQDSSSPVMESTQPWGSNAEQALKAMASKVDPNDPNSLTNYYWTPDGLTLNSIFTQIALDLSGSRGRLIDNSTPNLISGP